MNYLWASYVVALLLPYLVTLLLTPRFRTLAVAVGWIDRPGGRKRHAAPTALLGGVAVFASAAIGLLLSALVSVPVRAALWGPGSLAALGLGVAGIVALGAYDDRYDMRPVSKLVVQLVIATGTWILGFRCAALQLPFGWILTGGWAVSLLVTVAWIVLLTNAFNFIDGIDGLAAGVGIAAALTLVVLAAGQSASVPVLGSLALAGALAAFLRFNLPPATIFLGDAGAMAIGYSTAVLSVAAYQKAPTAMVIIVPLLAVGLPILDVLLVTVRRTSTHVARIGIAALSPRELVGAVMSADRRHIHHVLLRSGWSVRAILFTLYAISATLGALALWTRTADPTLRWAIWLTLLVGALVLLRILDRRVEGQERVEPSAAEPAERRRKVAG